MRKVGLGWLGLMIGIANVTAAQSGLDEPVYSDTAVVFSADDFYKAVLMYHPIAKQAALLPEEARQLVRQARGAFDPKVYSTYDRKEFGQSLYYQKWQSGLAIPILPGGMDIKLGYDNAIGEYVSTIDQVPPSGLAAVSLRIPVGMGLVIDARRSTLRQAQSAVDMAEADRLKLINKTLLDAAKTYWSWYQTYGEYQLYDEGYRLALTRFEAIRARALLGEAATIDTTEALISVQDRMVLLEQAQVELQNARLFLSTFLWRDASGGQLLAVELPTTALPQTALATPFDRTLLQPLLDQVPDIHPELLKIGAKAQQLEVEERYQRSLLQPQVALNVGLLSRASDFGSPYPWGERYAFGSRNYKIGAELVFPLLLRKERGKVAQVQIKRQYLDLERQTVRVQITADLRAAAGQLVALENQITLNQQSVASQRLLLTAEQEKFTLGESSLFLVNSRETKLIDMEVKGVSLQAKYQQVVATLWYLAGRSQPAVD